MAKAARAAVPAAIVSIVILVMLVIFAGMWMRAVHSAQTGGIQSVPVVATSNDQPSQTGSLTRPSGNQVDETRTDQLYQQGYRYYNEELYQKAIDMESLVIQDDPTYYPVYTIKGIALCYYGYFDAGNMKDKDFDEGVKDIDSALALKPDYSSALFNKALAYELYAHYDTALYWYDRTIAVEPRSVWSYYGKAAIYGRRGDVADTVKYLKQAIDLNPDVKKDARGEKDFDNVRNSPEFQSLVSD